LTTVYYHYLSDLPEEEDSQDEEEEQAREGSINIKDGYQIFSSSTTYVYDVFSTYNTQKC
jgi:hypothetical protein